MPSPASRRWNSRAIALPDDPLVVVIEGVEKPGNVGAVMRSADGAGADAVIAASPRTDLFNPNAIRASAGTMFTVPTGAAPTAEVIAWLRERGLRIVAARVGAGRAYTEADLTGPLALVLGARGGRPDGRVARRTASRPSTCRCSASPTA